MVCQVSKPLPFSLLTVTNCLFWKEHTFVFLLLKAADGEELFLYQRTLHVSSDHLGLIRKFYSTVSSWPLCWGDRLLTKEL